MSPREFNLEWLQNFASISGFAPNRRRGILARLRNLPIIRNYVQKELSKVALQVEGSLNKHYSKCEFILELPDKPWSPVRSPIVVLLAYGAARIDEPPPTPKYVQSGRKVPEPLSF